MTNAQTATKADTTAEMPMPEWLARRDREMGAWTVQVGAPVRGDAWTNLTDNVIRVPVGNDGASRVIRAHELVHARVSPQNLIDHETRFGITDTSIRAAEEFRVNTLVGAAGFNLDDLRDGSETQWGKRRAESEDWNGMVTDIAAMAGTKAAADYIRGVKGVNEDLAKAIREVEKAIVEEFNKIARGYVRARGRGRKAITPDARVRACKVIGSTDTDDENPDLPHGYVRFTIPLARLLDSMLVHPEGETGEEQEAPTAEEVKEATKTTATNGRWAPMILDRDVVLSRRVSGRLGRKRVAAATGKNPRRIDRMLVDPERRIFDRKVKGTGGIVVIDQSGSMHLSESDLWKIIEAAPGCTIIGYSHRPGSKSTPNVWVLAERGKVCETIREGNGGNGVDGPAIKFAATKRRSGEAFIWVCDGAVTNENDGHSPNLNEKAAALVLKHGIHMVYNVDQAIKALETAQTKRLPVQAVGNVSGTVVWRKHLYGTV